MKVAVLGASGLVGQVLVGRLVQRGRDSVVACVRNPATSWPLIRMGMPLVRADLRDADGLAKAIEGCTHVVNCALGEDRELVACMNNLVKACRTRGVQRLVHLSSVTVYGDPPGPDCVHETGVPRPKRGSYGWHKLRQDDVARDAHRSGLDTAVLCLPHVTGPNSRFLLSVLRELRERRFALVDGGSHPVVLADVANVAQAIELALDASQVDGERMFINDGTPTTWRMLVDRLAPMAAVAPESIPDLRETDVSATRPAVVPWSTTVRQILEVPEVRAILRRSPAGSDGLVAASARSLLKRTLAGRSRGGRALAPQRTGQPVVPPTGLWKQQLRKVPHSIDRARSQIGFHPEVSWDASMAAFERWFAATHQWSGPLWDLARRI
jgi:nucleoside-diphosphate-sugar epimerase